MTPTIPIEDLSEQNTAQSKPVSDHTGNLEKPEKKDREPFFKTLPGILTGIAGLLTAIGGLMTGLVSAGIINPDIGKASVAENGLYVVSTIPENHATGISAETVEIVIEFSSDIVADSYSFMMSDLGVTPEITGDPLFPEPDVCVVPVKLEPGTTYALGFNGLEHRNFISAEDESISADPYVLVFSTE